jgi:beta-lactamase class A
MLDIMAKARTGPRRLRGALPAGWHIAHKTGTGQDWRGASVGINDVALLTAPDGAVYSVAVMIRRTRQPVPRRLEMMQEVTKAVVDDWERSRKAAPAEDSFPQPTMAP